MSKNIMSEEAFNELIDGFEYMGNLTDYRTKKIIRSKRHYLIVFFCTPFCRKSGANLVAHFSQKWWYITIYLI